MPYVFRFNLDDPEEKVKGTHSSSLLVHSYLSSWMAIAVHRSSVKCRKQENPTYVFITDVVLHPTETPQFAKRLEFFRSSRKYVVVLDLTQTIFNLGGGVYTRG